MQVPNQPCGSSHTWVQLNLRTNLGQIPPERHLLAAERYDKPRLIEFIVSLVVKKG